MIAPFARSCATIVESNGGTSMAKFDVVVRRRAHVLRVVRILERRDDAVHRHRREVGIAAVLRVELGGALERIGLLAELFARGGRAGGQRARSTDAHRTRPCR